VAFVVIGVSNLSTTLSERLTLFPCAPYNATVHTLITKLAVSGEESRASYALARSSRWFQVLVAGLRSGLLTDMSDRLGLLSVS
jgi:hypothetical protein